MSTIVRHLNRNASALRAGESALLRWYPTTTLRRVARVRAMHPGYPLIHGVAPRLPLRGAEAQE